MAPTNPLPEIEPAGIAEQPFPLRRIFRRWLLPGLVLFSVLLMVMVAWGSVTAFRNLHLEIARQRAVVMVRLLEAAAPDAWRALLRSDGPAAALRGPQAAGLHAALRDVSGTLPAGHLAVLSPDGRVVFDARDPGAVGTRRNPDAIAVVVQSRRAWFRKDQDSAGTGLLVDDLDAVFVPIGHKNAPVDGILEFGVPMRRFEQVALQAGIVLGALPAVMLSLLLVGLDRLMIAAQREIDRRTRALAAARRAIGRLVSRRAVELATTSDASLGACHAANSAPALLYADVRDFTGFAETAQPEEIAGLLHAFTNAVTAAVEARGGDVDKLIADGALARFEGPDRTQRALEAARDLLEGLCRLSLPRGVGIGLFEGTASIVVLGSGSRRDITVVGDGVNVAARLSQLAAAGEIVAECDFLDRTEGASGFGWPEAVRVKGRRELLRVRRLSWPSPSPSP
jgi:class 3 adenylate cyclase